MTDPASQEPQTLSAGIVLPTGEQVYDSIMRRIEPELVFGNLETLDAAYATETPAERQERYARYAKAFQEYRTQYAAWIQQLDQAIVSYKRVVMRASESIVRTQENSVLATLEATMQAA